MTTRQARLASRVTLAAGCCAVIATIYLFGIYRVSLGASEHIVHLETAGRFEYVVDPPGRSLFRPGGVLNIYIDADSHLGDLLGAGTGQIVVRDSRGFNLASAEIHDLAYGVSSIRGRFLGLPREFSVESGGPYTCVVDIHEPFFKLAGHSQLLSVSHFVCGREAVYHWISGVVGGALLALSAWFRGHALRS